jgi:DNA-binding transcriptional LysR family regulator
MRLQDRVSHRLKLRDLRLLLALASGNFLGVLPRSLMWFGAELLSLEVLPIELPVRPGPVGIVTLKGRTLSPVAQLFIDRARDVTKHLAKEKYSA